MNSNEQNENSQVVELNDQDLDEVAGGQWWFAASAWSSWFSLEPQIALTPEDNRVALIGSLPVPPP